jgi:hypothetical protein
MREDTPFGPVWLFPDALPEKAAKHGARIELLWPDLEGFSAMHTGPPTGGAWVVRAPLAALERAGFRTDSAAEYPVKEGTVWPPIHIPLPRMVRAPWVTPEQLYNQDKRRRDWDEQERKARLGLEEFYRQGYQ